MRTTVTLPPGVGARVRRLAEQRGRSISSTLAILVADGLDRADEPDRIVIDPATGFPKISFGRTITPELVADLIDEDP